MTGPASQAVEVGASASVAYLVEVALARDGVSSPSQVVPSGSSCDFGDVVALPYARDNQGGVASVDEGVRLTLTPTSSEPGAVALRFRLSCSSVAFDRVAGLDLPNVNVVAEAGDVVLPLGAWTPIPSERIGRAVRVRISAHGA